MAVTETCLSCSIKQIHSHYTPLQDSENKSAATCATDGIDTQQGGISATLIVDVTTTVRKKSLYQSIIKSGLRWLHPLCHVVGLTELFSPATLIKVLHAKRNLIRVNFEVATAHFSGPCTDPTFNTMLSQWHYIRNKRGSVCINITFFLCNHCCRGKQ